jgi:hypothetical protein
LSSPKVLDERVPSDHDASVAVLFEAAHRSQPRLHAAMVGVDPGVGVSVGAMPCEWQQLLQYRWGLCCMCCERALSRQTVVMRTRRPRPATIPRSAFAGCCFPPEVIVLAVRWYLRFGLSFRDVEELLAERGVEVDHVTVDRWVQRFTPLLAEAARPCRPPSGTAGTWMRPT